MAVHEADIDIGRVGMSDAYGVSWRIGSLYPGQLCREARPDRGGSAGDDRQDRYRGSRCGRVTKRDRGRHEAQRTDARIATCLTDIRPNSSLVDYWRCTARALWIETLDYRKA